MLKGCTIQKCAALLILLPHIPKYYKMQILKRQNCSGIIFDTEHPEHREPSALMPAHWSSLHNYHRLSDLEFLLQFFPVGHSIYDQFGSSYFYTVDPQQPYTLTRDIVFYTPTSAPEIPFRRMLTATKPLRFPGIPAAFWRSFTLHFLRFHLGHRIVGRRPGEYFTYHIPRNDE